jgi:hypothetical protein
VSCGGLWGREEGREQGLRIAIADLCESYGVEVDDAQRTEVEALRFGDLEQLRASLKRDRRWPRVR